MNLNNLTHYAGLLAYTVIIASFYYTLRTKTADTPAGDAIKKAESDNPTLKKEIECSAANRQAIFNTGMALGVSVLGLVKVLKDKKFIDVSL